MVRIDNEMEEFLIVIKFGHVDCHIIYLN